MFIASTRMEFRANDTVKVATS